MMTVGTCLHSVSGLPLRLNPANVAGRLASRDVMCVCSEQSHMIQVDKWTSVQQRYIAANHAQKV